MNEENTDKEITDDVSFEPAEEEESEMSAQSKIKDLQEKLKAVQAEKSEYLLGWQKERADFANYKKDELKRKEEIYKMAREKSIYDFFPALDSFEMAFADKVAWEKADKNWRSGIEYIHQQLMSAFTENGVSAIGAVGDKFDPSLHESIESVPTTDQEKDHTISEVIQKGYKMGETILRVAKVKVFTLS